MYEDFKIETGKATAEYVLCVFQDLHRQGVALGEADEDIEITFDTTIAEWRDADDLRAAWEFAKAMNKAWQIDASREEWRMVMKPAKSKTLRGVCELIAREAIVSKLSPVTVFGVRCDSAGAFFAIRKLLGDVGVDVSNLAPSTPLAPFTRRYPGTFLGPIANLSPGKLPNIQYDDQPLHRLTEWGFVIGAIGTLVSLPFLDSALKAVTTSFFVISIVANWIVRLTVLPRSVTFGNFTTFRDLAKALVANPRAAQYL